MRSVGLRTTQFSLLSVLARAGQVRQGDLSGLTSLDETTLTRNLRPLVDAGWIAVRSGDDRREKLVTITKAGTAKLAEARPAWERAQTRMQALLPEGTWQRSMAILPEVVSADGRGLSFFGPIDAYTGCRRGQRLAASVSGGAMSTQLEEVARAGGSTNAAVTLTPQARRLLEGPVLPTLLRLAAPRWR